MEVSTAVAEVANSSNDPTMFNWFINCFYYEGDLIKTFLAIFGFCFILLFIFEAFYILKQGGNSLK